jgi:hypothetical protein
MKKIKIILGAGLLLLASCSDILDIKPTNFVSDAVIWDDRNLIDQFVANTYGSLVCGFNRRTQGNGQDWSAAFGGNFDSGTDDFDGKFDANVNQFNTGQITSLSTPFIDEIWSSNYSIIRKCNILIESIDQVKDLVLGAAERKRYKAEAHFLRAFCYFDLARTFGKAPLIDHVQQLDEDLLVAPTGFEGLVNFIVDECDRYAGDLYHDPLPAAEKGHATRGAFLALKARALLYLASPLNNPGNETRRWVEAAEAADAVRQLNTYSLYRQGSEPYYAQAFDKSDANREIIFERRFQFLEITHSIHMQWSLDGEDRGSWNGLYPTQNLVDAYEMDNGKPIEDPASGYDPQNPYFNRDNRFYQSILYHGSVWETATLQMHTHTAGGAHGNCQPSPYKARCGYGLKKFMEEYVAPAGDLYGKWSQDNNWPYFRYAEILLNYAEARNESLDAPDRSVYDAVNEVRDRAVQPGLPQGLGKDEMRDRIKNERRVELMLEEHRFFDLRRWKDAEKLRETIRGMNILWDGETATFVAGDVETRTFNETHYFLPIPQAEIDKNPLLAN